MSITVYQGDLPADLVLGDVVAVDTETMGLNPARDRLCVVQLSGGDGHAHLVQFAPGPIDAPHLCRLLTDSRCLKLLHYARFDLGMMKRHLGVVCAPVYCTKIASRLARTYTDRHGLKDLVRELLGIELDKTEQSSDWGGPSLSEAQLHYAARDVLYLHKLRQQLDMMLEREGRRSLAQACFDFLPIRAELDLAGWPEQDIFAH